MNALDHSQTPANPSGSKTSKSKQRAMIRRAFNTLCGCCEHTHKWDRYLDIIREEEKDHRRFKPDWLRCGLSKSESVQLFAVKEIFERFVPTHPSGEAIFTPKASDYLSVKESVFAACAIADLCEPEIRKAWTDAEMRWWLDSVDYVELNKDPKQESEAA